MFSLCLSPSLPPSLSLTLSYHSVFFFSLDLHVPTERQLPRKPLLCDAMQLLLHFTDHCVWKPKIRDPAKAYKTKHENFFAHSRNIGSTLSPIFTSVNMCCAHMYCQLSLSLSLVEHKRTSTITIVKNKFLIVQNYQLNLCLLFKIKLDC